MKADAFAVVNNPKGTWRMRTRTTEPSTVGDILREEFLKPAGMTERQLAEQLACSREEAELLLRGKRSLKHQEAVGLSRAFQTSPDFWINLQSAHDCWKEEKRFSR